MHKEDQQATCSPTSLGVTSEAKANPQLSSDMLSFNLNKPIYLASFIIHSESASGNDASTASTAAADPGNSAPSTDPHVLADQTKSVSEGSETVLTQPITEKGASSVASQIEEETSSTIKLEDLAKLVSHVKPSFKNLDSPKDNPVIVVNDSDEDEDDEVHATENLKEILVKSLKTKFSNILSAHDVSSSLPTELKDLPSKFNDLTEEVKGLKNQVYNLEIKLPGELKEILLRLEAEFLAVPSQVEMVQAKLKTLDALPSLLNKVTNALNQFAHAITSKKTRDKGKKALSSEQVMKECTKSDFDDDETHLSRSMKIEEEAKTETPKRESEVRKKELFDLLRPEVVNKYYNDKLHKQRLKSSVQYEDHLPGAVLNELVLETEQGPWLELQFSLVDDSKLSVVYLLKSEINEVKTIFNQMEATVEQCSVDKKYFDIQKKELFLDNDRLLEHIICQEVMNIVMHTDVVSALMFPVNNNKCLVHDNLEIERLEQENDHLFELILSQDIEVFEINNLQAKIKAKDVSITNLRKHIESLKGKNMVEKDVPPKHANVIALRMFRLDLEPLSFKLLKNRDAHIDYIKHTHKHADTLWEIVEQARALKPLDNDLDSAYKYTKQIQEVLAYVTATCHSLTKSSEKLVAITPLNNNKKVRFAEPATSSSNTVENTKKYRISRTTSSNKKNKVEDHPRSIKSSSNNKNHVSKPVCNANVQHSLLNVNFEIICVTCNECMFDEIHDLCVLDFVNDVSMRSKSKSTKRSQNRNVWKPSDKVFTNVGYRRIPTGQKFTIDGHRCPLTRITSTNVVPPNNPLPTKVTKKSTPHRNNPKMLKDVTNISLSSRSKGVESNISNNSEPNQNWGSNVFTAPSSPRVNFWWSKSSSGTWTLVVPICHTPSEAET
ncbi:hypothetical protein Tco_0345676 [Tanacetum coccineum]